MVNSLKRLNKIQIISTILLIVSFILVCFNVKSSEYLFWVFLSLNMLGLLLFVDKWSKEGRTRNRKMDKSYNKNFTRKSSELIFFMIIIYFLIVCAIIIIDVFVGDFMYSFGVILTLLIIAIIWNLVSLYVVDRTSKEVELLLKKRNK